MSGTGRPGELHPRTAGNQLGLDIPGGQVTWAQVLDAAVEAYWLNRVPITTAELIAHRQDRKRQQDECRRQALRQRQEQQDTTPPQVWIRRAGAA